MKRFLLLSDAPADGGGGSPPPAAETVINSDAREGDAAEIVRLRRELAESSTGRKAAEIRLSELEDENWRLKTPEAAPIKQAAQKKGFLEGATFFG